MKADEVLRRYAAGERDFRRVNLRGQWFKGKDLSGVDFSEADIRGANFTKATLHGAKFRRAKAGLSHCWAIKAGLIIISLVLSALSQSVTVTIILITFIAVFVASAASKVESKATIVALTVTAVLSIAGTVSLVLAVAISVVRTKFESLVVAKTGGITLAFALIGFVALALIGTRADLISVAVDRAGAGFIRVSLALVGELVKIAMTVTGGTSFRGADLTGTDFSQANLQNTNLREAVFKLVRWNQAENLAKALFSRSYLNRPNVQQLLTKGAEQGENFEHQNLRGINLQGANLADASFIGADLSEANLHDADLSRSILVQTQLDEADLTGATLTGATIEDWGITSQTKLHGVKCEYIFMRVPTKEDPNPRRKPDNWKETFSDGDFADFIKPIVDTLDLYHNSSVDPRAIAISFKQLAENNPDAELEIVAMEKRGKDKFLLRAVTTSGADRSQLSADYFSTYNQVRALTEADVQKFLHEKDRRIASLETMIETALQRPSFYLSNQIKEVTNMTNNPGGFSVGGSVGGDIRNLQGDKNRAIQGDNNQGVLGNNNQVTQGQGAATTEEPLTKADVIALLAELDKLVRVAELPEDTKEEATMYLGAAKKATEKEEPKKETALANLQSVAETLETASKAANAGANVWDKAKPIIIKVASWLGAAAGSYFLGL